MLALDGLDSAATEALAAGLLGTNRLPAGLVERLPTSTDGNPLFVRELVRMLVDDEVIRRRGDEWELTIDAAAVEVPPTIQSLLAARVERLPHDERTVLELASVIGAEFNVGALRELAGPDTPLPTRLESMRRKELVEPTGAYWGDEPVYRFHHVLIRDAAYRRLLKTTRADLHEKVAVWTDAAAANRIGEHEAVIAFHYEQAHRYRVELGTVDEHATELGRRAAELLSTAADRALGRDDLAAAGALARRALVLLPESDAAARADLLLIACECTLASGDVVGARPVVEQLRVEAGDDPALGAWAWCFEAQLIGLTDPDGLVGAEAIATGAAKVMEELGDGAGEAKAHQVRAGLLARLGRVGDAELELDLALGAARRVDDRRRVTAVLGAAPNAALWGPSPVARAGGRCLDVVRLLRITTASPSVEATSMRCQAVLEALRGRFDVARSMLASSRATLEELGLRHGLLETAYLTGVVELVAGDPAAAIGPLRDAYAGLIEMGVGIDAGRAAALLAHALVAVGRVDDAEPMAAASEELAGQDLKTAIAWRGARAEVLAARGDVGGGIALATEAVDIAAATDLVIDHADACVTLAALHAAAGDAAAAQVVRTEAKRLYDLKGATVPAERLADNAVAPPAPIATPAPAPAPDRAADATGARRHGSSPRPRREPRRRRSATRLYELYVAGQMDQVRALLADDAVLIDKRSIIGMDVVGGDAIVANLRAAVDLGLVAARVEPLAVRGSTLGLGRITTDFGSFESVFLNVGQVDADGLVSHIILFDEDALADALAELDARYFAGEGREVAAAAQNVADGIAATNRRDWQGLIDLYAPEFTVVDHRQLGWPAVDRDGMVAMLQGYVELAPDLFLLSRKYHIARPSRSRHRRRFRHDHRRQPHRVGAALCLPRRRSRRIIRGVVRRARIRCCRSRVSTNSARRRRRIRATLEPRTSAMALADRLCRAVRRRADGSAFARCWPTTPCSSTRGRSSAWRWRAVTPSSRASVPRSTSASLRRGPNDLRSEDRRSRWVVSPPTSAVSRANTSTSVSWMPTVASPTSSCSTKTHSPTRSPSSTRGTSPVRDARSRAATQSLVEGLAALNRRDWPGFLDRYAPEFTQIDHRQLGWPTVDRDGVVAMLQGYVELAPDLFLLPRKYHVRDRAVLVTSTDSARPPTATSWSGCSTTCALVERPRHLVRGDLRRARVRRRARPPRRARCCATGRPAPPAVRERDDPHRRRVLRAGRSTAASTRRPSSSRPTLSGSITGPQCRTRRRMGATSTWPRCKRRSRSASRR